MRRTTQTTKVGIALLALGTLAGCSDELPTATHPSTPVEPVTFEVRLPWSQFATNLRVLSGFGGPVDAPVGIIAHQYQGELEARTIVRYPNLPRSWSVLDSLGTTRTDTLLSFIGSNIIIQFDSTAHTNTGPVFLNVDRVDAPWDEATATWELAVDSGAVEIPWAQPGGGPLVRFAEGGWDPSTGNQTILPLDSAETAFLGDTTKANRGIMVSLTSAGQRLDVQRVVLQLQVIPSVNQDSVFFIDVDPMEFTYLFTPEADPPPANELRAGGTPAWRSVLTLALPSTVQGTPAACALTTCPVVLTADRINHASLLLTTKPTDPVFAPLDTMEFEIRGVLAPEYGPKSPLAPALYLDSIGESVGTLIQPGAFGSGGPRVVELAITPLLRNLVAGSTGVFRPTPTITLMETEEPFSFSFGSFVGPGQPGEPILRLLLTISDPVGLP